MSGMAYATITFELGSLLFCEIVALIIICWLCKEDNRNVREQNWKTYFIWGILLYMFICDRNVMIYGLYDDLAYYMQW